MRRWKREALDGFAKIARTMNFDGKLRQVRLAASKNSDGRDSDGRFQYLQRMEQITCKLPAGPTPQNIEEYVEGRVGQNVFGEFFLSEQTLPFGRPYGAMRVGDFGTTDLASLNLFLAGASLPEISRLAFLDTETTGLLESADACAFLIGVGKVEGTSFVVRQFFLRQYAEEKAVLVELARELNGSDGLITFNGKAFDVPLLENRYGLARMKSPFARLLHLDLLHPARRLWKLRIGSCRLGNLERYVLGIAREGDVAGAEIPGIYFEYLRTWNASALEPVFFHNALDIVSLVALAMEMAQTLRAGQKGEFPVEKKLGNASVALDLFSLSCVFARAGARDASLAACRRAIAAGLPEAIERRALRRLETSSLRRRKRA